MPSNSRHIVIVAYLGWGHLRGLCILAARLVKVDPAMQVTFFTSRGMYDRVQSEIQRDFGDKDEHLRANIAIVALRENQEKLTDIKTFDLAFAEQLRNLVSGQDVWCAKKEQAVRHQAKSIPNAVIVDLFAYDQLLLVRDISPSTKVLCWSVAPTYGVLAVMGPFGPDTKGLRRRQVEERMARTEESLEDAAYHVLGLGQFDRIREVPGLPPMYDYESASQKMPTNDYKNASKFHLAAADLYHEADGFIVPTFEAFEPAASVQAMREFLNLTSRKMYMVGPLLPVDGDNASKHELQQSSKGQEIEAFMERILRDRGETSLVYMSFGSEFWSGEPEKIWAFVDTLIEMNIPFVFAAASRFAKVPFEVQQKLETSKSGLITNWAPQQVILNHRVTGWFVSHCGLNSVLETISAGVPIIAWPFGAEQPFNAAHCTVNLGIAFEVFETRSDKALTVLRSGITHTGSVEAVRAEAKTVLGRAFGAEGEAKRAKILELRRAAAGAWDEGGMGKRAVEELLGLLQ